MLATNYTQFTPPTRRLQVRSMFGLGRVPARKGGLVDRRLFFADSQTVPMYAMKRGATHDREIRRIY